MISILPSVRNNDSAIFASYLVKDVGDILRVIQDINLKAKPPEKTVSRFLYGARL